MNLQSKFGYCMNTQTLNTCIALNVGWTELQTDIDSLCKLSCGDIPTYYSIGARPYLY